LHKAGITYQRLSEKDQVLNSIKDVTEKDWAVYKKRDKTWLSKSNQKTLKEGI
jgi:hypothetical protein